MTQRATGYGWGCLRFFTAFLVLLFTFIGLVALLGSRAGLLPFLLALGLGVFWFMVARNYRWEWGLLFGVVLALLAMLFFEVLGYLLHRGQPLPSG